MQLKKANEAVKQEHIQYKISIGLRCIQILLMATCLAETDLIFLDHWQWSSYVTVSSLYEDI